MNSQFRAAWAVSRYPCGVTQRKVVPRQRNPRFGERSYANYLFRVSKWGRGGKIRSPLLALVFIKHDHTLGRRIKNALTHFRVLAMVLLVVVANPKAATLRFCLRDSCGTTLKRMRKELAVEIATTVVSVAF